MSDQTYTRELHVGIRASIADLSLQGEKGTWAPSTRTLEDIFKQVVYNDLAGKTKAIGDLKSVVLNDISISNISSDFPLALGVNVFSVDNKTYTLNGNGYSVVVPPKGNISAATTLQKDDVNVVMEFAKKFPGYTSNNISSRGVHHVGARKFVLLDPTHPVVTAINDNAERLQTEDIQVLPDDLVKVTQSVYDELMPHVMDQIKTQVKVRNFQNASVSIQPAEFPNWKSAMDEMDMDASTLDAVRNFDAHLTVNYSFLAPEDEE